MIAFTSRGPVIASSPKRSSYQAPEGRVPAFRPERPFVDGYPHPRPRFPPGAPASW